MAKVTAIPLTDFDHHGVRKTGKPFACSEQLGKQLADKGLVRIEKSAPKQAKKETPNAKTTGEKLSASQVDQASQKQTQKKSKSGAKKAKKGKS